MFGANYQIQDKTIASFTGRPPALSRRYVTTPMQLDLPPEIVYRESNHAVLKSLVDPTGWGYQENPAAYSAAFYRGNTVGICCSWNLIKADISRYSGRLEMKY